jgi:uncharacterized protein involved in exopolysaccharide biosynthesis
MTRLSVSEAQQRRSFFESKVGDAKLKLAESDKLLRSTGIDESTLKSSPLAAIEIVAKLKGAITAQEIKIGGMRGYLTDSSTEVKQAFLELKTLQSQLTKAERDEHRNSGEHENSYVERYRDYKYKEALYEMFAKQYELARIDEAREGAVIQVVDPAQPPEKKTKPKKALIGILSTFVTGIILLMFILIRAKFHESTQNEITRGKIKNLKQSWKTAFKY